MNTKVIILSAGKGERLRPLTNSKPKCLVKLFGKTILQHQIDVFTKLSINDITVVTGYLNNMINQNGITCFHNPNYEVTNMVETLFCANGKLENDVIISYGDIIFEKKIVEKLLDSNDDFSIIIDKKWRRYWEMRFSDPLEDAETLKIDSNGYISEIGQKTKNIDEIQGQYIGLMRFRNNGLRLLKKYYHEAQNSSKNGSNPLNSKLKFEQSYMTDLLNYLISKGCNLKPISIENGWLELDSIDDLQIYNELYETNSLSKFFKV
jgi:L-glutamine-phosphate cytidylyltransferase